LYLRLTGRRVSEFELQLDGRDNIFDKSSPSAVSYEYDSHCYYLSGINFFRTELLYRLMQVMVDGEKKKVQKL
jgi:hypothetical protein